MDKKSDRVKSSKGIEVKEDLKPPGPMSAKADLKKLELAPGNALDQVQ
jgi:hypothetical protein